MWDHIDLSHFPSNHFFFKFLRKITRYQKLVEQVLTLQEDILLFGLGCQNYEACCMMPLNSGSRSLLLAWRECIRWDPYNWSQKQILHNIHFFSIYPQNFSYIFQGLQVLAFQPSFIQDFSAPGIELDCTNCWFFAIFTHSFSGEAAPFQQNCCKEIRQSFRKLLDVRVGALFFFLFFFF